LRKAARRRQGGGRPQGVRGDRVFVGEAVDRQQRAVPPVRFGQAVSVMSEWCAYTAGSSCGMP
jgi:hypothetical protein